MHGCMRLFTGASKLYGFYFKVFWPVVMSLLTLGLHEVHHCIIYCPCVSVVSFFLCAEELLF